MVLIRLCKIALVATIAVFFSLVAFGNVTDYGTNWAFVQYVLAMDTIFPDSTLRWRAITDERLQTAAYVVIIATQAAVALVLWAGVVRMLAALRAPGFRRALTTAVLGLTLGLLLYGAGFVVIGGEWFAMWQSKTWNGQSTAFAFIGWISAVLILLLLPEQEEER